MKNGLLIGIGAGLAATLCFLSGAGGSLPIAIILSVLTPLPLLLAGLGWGYLSAAIASLVAAASIAALAGGTAAIIFILLFGLLVPALCHFALLSREVHLPQSISSTAPSVVREWYPLGRLLVLVAGSVGTLGVCALLVASPEPEDHRATLKAILLQMLELSRKQGKGPSEAEIDTLASLYAPTVPAIWAAHWVTLISANLWLAGIILHSSGRLPRAWPPISSFAYPTALPLVFGATLFAVPLQHPFGTLAVGLAGALFAAFALLGLAVLHWITHGNQARPLLLTIAYLLAIVLFPLGTAMIAMLGLSDPIFRLRRNNPQPPRPPATPMNPKQ